MGGSDRDERRRPQGSPEKERPSRSVTSRSGAGDLAIEAVSRPGAATLRFGGGGSGLTTGGMTTLRSRRPCDRGQRPCGSRGGGHDLAVGGQRAHRQQCSFSNAALVDQCAGSTLTMWKPGTSMSISRILV